jgi:DNA-directed RNA polymerase subunit beta'
MSGTQSVATADGELYGHQAIKHMLDNVDLDVAYEKAKKAAATSKEASDRSRGYRVMKSIDMLRGNDMSPADAFMRRQVLVLPANIRGLRRDQNSGDWVIGDLNYLYRDLGMINRELVKAREIGQPPKVIAQLEAGLYEGMKSLMQSEGSVPLSGTGYQGVLGTLAGRRPDPSGKDATNVKESLFKKTLLQRRQIMSGRTVLAPDSDIDMDEVILPRKMAVAIMEPLIEAEWNRRNPPSSGGTRRNNKLRSFRERLESYKLENKRDQEVDRILENVIRDRWVAVKRDPVLHKYGVQGFKPVLRDTKTVGLHPVVYGGLNADNDGDTLAIFAPISKKASNELRDKLRPTKNLFNPASGQLEYTVSHEAILGISRATKSQGKDTGKSFNSLQAATNAYNDNQFDVNDVIDVNGRKVSYGLHLLDEALPDGHKMEDLVQKGVLPAMTDPAGLTKKQINGVLTHIAKEAPQSFSSTAAGFREVGQNVATTSGATLLLDDLKPVLVDERRRVENELYRELGKVKGIVDSGERQERTRQIFKDKLIGITDKAMTELRKTMTDKRPNMTAELTFTGARVKPGQLQQVLFAPGALTDAKDQVVESPVMQSYTEGLDMANYWASMHGARMGTVSKVVQVQEPGYLTKQLVNTSMDQSITEVDCGTTRGVEVDLSASTDDLYGRVLAAPVKVAGMNLSPGESLTPQIVSEINRKTSAKNPKVRVRSPLYCEAKEGICQVCAGRTPTGEFHAKGTNFGIIAAQSVGERSTQLMLSLFHGGGVYDPKADTEGKTSVKDMYHQASALMRMPRTMGGKAAVVAPVSGKIEKVETDTRRGGYNLQLEGAKSVFLPAERRAPNGKKFRDFYKPGDSIKAGDVLTDGIANPKAILETTGDMDKAREYLVNRMNSLYSGTGVLRRNIEALVRGVSNTVEVVGSGKTDYLPGQRISLQEAEAAKKEDPSFRFTNILKGVDVAPREVREDFMARLNYNNLRRTIIDSAAVGAESRYHGTHPIPALAYAAEFNRDGRYGAVRSDGRY